MVPARSLIALTVLMAAVVGIKADDYGRLIYVERCAGCHGEQLQGQPDWMKRLPTGRLPAPPHDASGHTWHHSDDQLMRLVRDGLASISPGYETDMPAFGTVMSEAEIRSVLDYIKTTWPDRERGYQEARSEGDP